VREDDDVEEVGDHTEKADRGQDPREHEPTGFNVPCWTYDSW